MKRNILPLQCCLPKKVIRYSVLSVALLLINNILYSQNLITNGDFESGGSGVGFTSNYNLTAGPTSSPQTYAIVSNPATINPVFSSSCVDHTTGSGKMLVADGANGSQNKIWEQVPGGGLSVQSGRTYIFSYWIQSISSSNAVGNLPNIEVRFNNVVATPTSGSTVCPATLCGWTQVTYTFTTTATYLQIWLFDLTTSSTGNDFAIDDLSLTIVPLPLSVRYAAVNPSCPNSTDGFIAVYGDGGVPPYTYSLNGSPYTVNNIFTGLGTSANNFVSVKDAAIPTPATATSPATITLTPPADPLIVRPDTTICVGASVTLSASGGTGGYTWTAVPPDPTLTTPNIANPVVSPAVTTTYTVNSSISTTQNLIYNPGFEAGNGGFETGYQFYTNTTNQNAYGITTNPKAFDINFSVCPDHTTGTGNMMVVDGATVANSKIWCQTVPVEPATTYTFSYWIQTVSLTSPGRVETQVNGTPITGVAATSSFTAPATGCTWVQQTYTWNSGANTTAQICLYDRNLAATGNDFAFDDLFFGKTTTCDLAKTVTVTVSNVAVDPVVTSPVSYCQNAVAVPLTATGTNLLWYTTATGGVGTSIAPTPVTIAIGSVTYYVTQTTGCGTSQRVPIVVNITSTTAAPTVTTPVNYCQNETAVPLTATGTSLLWYTVASGGVGSSTAPTPATNATGSTTYYVSQTQSCGESPRSAIIVNVSATPAAPVVTTPVTYCQNETATQLTATGTNLLWYTTATGGTGSATAPIPVTTATGSTTYYVSQSTGSCEGAKAVITVTVNNAPAAPVVSTPVTYCQNDIAVPLTATGTNLLWYTAATGGVGSSTAPTPVTTAAGSTTYYVSQSTGSCESPRTAITVTINAIPAAPVINTPVTYCQDEVAVPLTATGTNLLWYTAATGGVGSSTAPTPSTAGPGSTTYYVSQSVSSCEGPRAAIVVTITATPVAPTVSSPVSYCQNATATALTATGTNLLWYTVATGGTGSTTAPTPSTSTIGNTTWYVSQSTGTCEGPRASITVEITLTTAAPTVSSPVNYCQGETAVPLTATGTGLLWYTSASGGTGDATAPTPSTATFGSITYYVSQTQSCGESPRAAIVVTVAATPATPVVSSPVTYCENETAVPLTAIGTNLLWYTTATGGTGSSTAPIPLTTTSGNTIYYVSEYNGSCESQRAAISVIVNATPAVPTVTPELNYCQNAVAVPLTASGGTGTVLLWYTSSSGGTGSVVAPIPSTGTPGSTLYYVSQSAGNCESPRAMITVTVNAVPAAPTVNSPLAYCQNIVAVPLTASGTNLLWYTAATGGAGSSTAPTPVTSIVVSTTWYVSQTVNGCESPRAPLTVTVNTAPVAPVVTSPVSYCQDDIALPLIAAGTGLLWYSTASGGTGTSLTPVPSTLIPGTFTYYASQSGGTCESPRAAITVTVKAKPVIDAGGPTVEIFEGQSITLNGTASGNNISILWTPNIAISSISVATPKVSPSKTQLYTMTVTSQDGCKAVDEVTVVVRKELIIPNAFSPNGDGTNDKWIIKNIEQYPNASISVFNRYGQFVFESNGYAIPWDGTCKGSPLPVAAYFYIIQPANGSKPLKGTISILR